MLDIGKYVFTVGIPEGLLGDRLKFKLGLFLFGIGFTLLIVDFLYSTG
ncbi:hypothetical protein TDIS_0452 [Thermosulfurimonas dismutans]|uniref:Uncharacterized protein n=1 Tax=Thermosulfurimonas dismutans TaxID=999894 RepID=A0A179D707_9BACT|nr:hypothetical protein TDIS_0452 [Thermosulfurimonas dismutans]